MIADRFEVEREIGSGGMGTVYRAHDRASGRDVAVKVLHASRERARFEREAAVLASLTHPAIVGYVAHGVTEAPWLAMEWLDGESLETRLVRGRLSVGDTLDLARRVADGLAAAHGRGVVHRDLKPSNLLLEGGSPGRTTILDFGIALLRFDAEPGARRDTKVGKALGTPGYMAPEQARGERDVDARADVFSLGCVVFECLTGKPAFAGAQAMAILAKILLEEPPRAGELAWVPAELDALVASMLAKDRVERPADAGAVLAALETLRATLPPSTAQPQSLTEREQRIASIILVGAAPTGTAPTGVDAHTGTRESMDSAVGAFEARIEPMVGGTVAVLLRGAGGGAASDAAARAAACALALRRAAPEAAIALATGRAVEGFRGRVPVGEAIDRAARLLASAASGAAIRMDAVTEALLDDRYERWPDPADAGDVWTLVGRRRAEAVRTLLGRPTPCIGRDSEIAGLLSMISQCIADGAARAIVVTGPAGIGKSRLRHEVVSRLLAAPDPPEVWFARGEPVGAHSAFALAAQAVRGAAGLHEGEPGDLRRERLVARVSRHVPEADRARVAAFIGEMIGAPFPDEEDVQLRSARRDATVMGDQIRRAWEDLLLAEASAHPLVLVLEDLHWGDLPTITLADAALRLSRDAPLVVLAFARPEIDALFPNLWQDRGVMRMPLRGLTRKASGKLIETVLGAAATPDVVARLADQAAGNAFYLEELVRAVSEGREELPETVLGMVEARLVALDPEARRVLRAASVFGQAFWRGGVAALLGEGGEVVAARELDDLVKRELVTPGQGPGKFAGETELTFRHALVREAAHAMLTDEDRAVGHRLAAAWLEAAGETDAIALGEHHELGGEEARAAAAFLRAAEQALEGNDFSAAVERAERGTMRGSVEIDEGVLGRLRLIQAEAHSFAGDNAASAACAYEATSLLEIGSERWGRAAGWLAVASARLGDIDRVVAVAEDLGAVLRSGTPEAGCLHAAARVCGPLVHAARADVARPLLEAAAAGHPADPCLRGRIALARALMAHHEGDLTSYLRLCAESVLELERGGDARVASGVRVNLGFGFGELGAYAEAERALTVCLASAERMGLGNIAAAARNNLGWALARQGRLDEAVRVESAAVRAFAEQGDVRLEGGSRNYLAAILLQADDLASAEREARAAIALLEASPPLRRYALATLARVLFTAGRREDALEAARQAVFMLENVAGSLGEGEALARLTLAETLDASGDRPAAAEALERARARLLGRAATIGDARLRQSFLEIPEHARTLALAEAWLDVSDRPGDP